MRIAIFTETYLPYINGVVTHIKILRDGLILTGHDVLIVTADKNVRSHILHDGVLRCPALEFKKIYGYGISSPLSNTRQRMIKDFNPDIIHIQQEFGICLAGIQASRILDVPLIYTLHTMYDDYIYYIAPKHLTDIARQISHRYVRFIARRADIITGPSQKCAEYLQAAKVNRKVHVIPNSVELENYTRDATTPEQILAVRHRYNIPADAFIACFCGRLGKEKGLDNLIELWKDNFEITRDMYLMIIGSGPFRDTLEEMVSNAGLRDHIIFTGAILHEELPPYYAACDAYVTASLTEMYSISMLEAQASGLPVIQRFDPKNVDQIKVGVNGWLFHSSEEFGLILRELSSMGSQEKEAMKMVVRDSIKERSSVGIANYLLELYRLAIERRKNGQRASIHEAV
jgi:1,2-diacylglycerol 3-alpha-glucosyltransferase